MPIISIPKQLREKLGDEASESLVEMLNHYSLDNRESIIESATQRYETRLTHEVSQLKANFSDLREEMIISRTEIKEDLTRTEQSIRDDLGGRISTLREEMYRNNANNIKWMFVFWIGQIGAILGILFAFFS